MQWVLLTDTVIVFNDDFGYLRSVVETFRRGRPWTDDWLEPWSASFSMISAVVWKTTGSFKLATHGVQVACVAVGAIGAAFLLIRRGFSGCSASLIAAALFTTPTILWKNLEFTAFGLYLACFFQAAYAAERQRWLAFSVWTCLALTSRQSALAWLALPATEWLYRVRTRNRANLSSSIVPLAIIFCGFGFYLLCQVGMNRTHAQRVMTSAMWGSLQLRSILHWLGFSLFLIYTALGFGNLAVAVLTPHSAPLKPLRWGAVLVRFVAPVIVISALVAMRGRFDLQYEHSLLTNPFGISYLVACAVLAIAGWAAKPMVVDAKLLAGAFCCAAITSIRGAVWDYYLVDTVLFAFLCVRPPTIIPSLAGVHMPYHEVARVWNAGWYRLGGATLLVAVIAPFHAAFITVSKRTVDNFEAAVVLGEKALRSHKIDVTELSFVPFGFIGWHLYPYFVTHEGAQGAYIAGFLDYLRPATVRIETRGVKDRRPLEHPETVLASEVFAIGWGEQHRFTLRRTEPNSSGVSKISAADYRYQPFPLDDAEWRELVRRQPAKIE